MKIKICATLIATTASLSWEHSSAQCACDGSVAQASRRRNLIIEESPEDRINNFNFGKASVKGESFRRPKGASGLRELSEDNHKYKTGCDAEQVHISFAGPTDSMVVQYTSRSVNTKSEVEYATDVCAFYDSGCDVKLMKGTGDVEQYSQTIYIADYLTNPPMGKPFRTPEQIRQMEDTSAWAYDKDTGEHWANWMKPDAMVTGLADYANPQMYYDSPYLHEVTLTELKAGQTYLYRVSGSCKLYSFKMPGEVRYPINVGLTADVGQTEISTISMDALKHLDPDYILLAGDLAYSDGFPELWDRYGKIVEPLASRYPILTTGGNHEVFMAEQWISYEKRYFTPYKSAGSPNHCYYGKVVGPVHYIVLCSYVSFSNTSVQYTWLENYLQASIDRKRTPWVVAMFHAPFYSSNTDHWKEGELMRYHMEPLLFQYGVDFALCGHVHSYERSHPTYNYDRNKCGTTYLNLGDAGNYEGAAAPWRMENYTESIYEEGEVQRQGPPIWSAFRESSFGVAQWQVFNETHSYFSWHRHACQSASDVDYHMDVSSDCVTAGDNSAQRMETSDEVWIVRPDSSECPNRWRSSRGA